MQREFQDHQLHHQFKTKLLYFMVEFSIGEVMQENVLFPHILVLYFGHAV